MNMQFFSSLALEIPLFLKRAAMPRRSAITPPVQLQCTAGLKSSKEKPWPFFLCVTHARTQTTRWCQFTFQVHRLCCYTTILALPWSGVHTVVTGLCKLAGCCSAFGLPWHVLTCSTPCAPPPTLCSPLFLVASGALPQVVEQRV